MRSWEDADRESLIRHANNRKIWRNLFDRFPHPYTAEDADSWLSHAASLSPVTRFAIEVDGVAAGGIGFDIGEDVHRRSAAIGYWLGESFWGRGIATEAAQAVTKYVFTHFDVVRIDAAVFAWNPASMRVLEKIGYTREGIMRKNVYKDGQIIDQVVYAILRDR